MARKGGGFGIVILVITMAVVLLMVAQAWKKVGPTAIDVDRAADSTAFDSHGEQGAAVELRSGGLPKITDAVEGTNAHSADVQDALASID